MTTTNYTVGISDERNSSKVLKPPGGETHDIFGQHATVDHVGSQRGRNQGHLHSSVFDEQTYSSPTTEAVAASDASIGGADRPPAGRRPNNGNANGNMNRIFGSDATDQSDGFTPARKVKDYHKSNIFGIGDDPNVVNGNVNASHRRPNINNHEMISAVGTAYTPSKRRQCDQNDVHRGYGNPITGEGYANGSPKTDNGNPGARGRNPPGGHSTNLW